MTVQHWVQMGGGWPLQQAGRHGLGSCNPKLLVNQNTGAWMCVGCTQSRCSQQQAWGWMYGGWSCWRALPGRGSLPAIHTRVHVGLCPQ
jgi:hypothetical protein